MIYISKLKFNKIGENSWEAICCICTFKITRTYNHIYPYYIEANFRNNFISEWDEIYFNDAKNSCNKYMEELFNYFGDFSEKEFNFYLNYNQDFLDEEEIKLFRKIIKGSEKFCKIKIK